MTRVFKVALLGAESTGKTQLAHALAAHWRGIGAQAHAVDEHLRLWCEQAGHTPLRHEQAGIAQTQREQIEQAARELSNEESAQMPPCVFADTTPVMTAVYSEFFFQDKDLHASALAYQRSFDLTLVTGLDMPWQADGIQRDGAHVRPPIDALLRRLLQQGGVAFEVIYGLGAQRVYNTLQALQRHFKTSQATPRSADTTYLIANNLDSTRDDAQLSLKKWQWNCDQCSDPECEHRLFTRLQIQ